MLSDFYDDEDEAFAELRRAARMGHDVAVFQIVSRAELEFPYTRDLEFADVETGRTRVLSRRELSKLAGRVREWQDGVARQARDAGLDVVRVGLDRWEMETALVEFTAERRLRKTK